MTGVLSASWNTLLNSPEEWKQSWKGYGQRYLQREADVAISNSLEGGVGALWGEEPRYIPSGLQGIGPRAGYALKTVFLSQRRDGQLHPAWGRVAGNTVNNLIENSWLPPSARTAGQTSLRCALGFVGRAGGNAFEEFWPDVRKLFSR